MHIPRIYINQDLNIGQKLILPEGPAHHIQHVLRCKAGDPLLLFNGQGGEFHSTILNLAKRRIEVSIDDSIIHHTESSLDTTIGISVLKRDAMNAALQRATELGVSRIIPVLTANCSVSHQQISKREQHWQLIIESSCEQSGRVKLPALLPTHSFSDWLVRVSDLDLKLLASLSSGGRLADIVAEPQSVGLLIGPEGGITADEEKEALTSGFVAIRFGGRILRAETAPAALLSLLQYRWGDY